MEGLERSFKGIWIPREIWLSKTISPIEKLFLAEINSLDNENGCFASNQYFVNFFELSLSRVKQIILNLEEKGFIFRKLIYKENSKEIKKRILRVGNWNQLLTAMGEELYRMDFSDPRPKNRPTPSLKTGLPRPENRPDSNIPLYNKLDNTSSFKKINKKENSLDEDFQKTKSKNSSKPKRKKRKPKEQNNDLRSKFVQEVSKIYPKHKTCKEGFRRLEKYFDNEIKTNKTNQESFIKNLKACIELKQSFMFELKNYAGTVSEKSKNYHKENWIEKLQSQKEYQDAQSRKNNNQRYQPEYSKNSDTVELKVSEREKARQNFRLGIRTPGFGFSEELFGIDIKP